MDITVFFSWQSDTPPATGRALVERALKSALTHLASDAQLDLRPDLDQDTQRVPGSPPMVAAILEKVDRCSVFVADVTLTHRPTTGADKLSPNPNVAFELGYAMRRLTHSRVLLIMNLSLGGPELLPFDLRGHRAVTFSAPAADGDDPREFERLSASLVEELRLILGGVGPPDDVRPALQLKLEYRKSKIESDRHDYRLVVAVENLGTAVVQDWTIEVQVPRALLDSRQSYPEVPYRSTHQRVVMRLTDERHSGPIYPGDAKEVFGIDYHMDHTLYDQRGSLFSDTIQAAFFVAGQRVAVISKAVREMQNF